MLKFVNGYSPSAKRSGGKSNDLSVDTTDSQISRVNGIGVDVRTAKDADTRDVTPSRSRGHDMRKDFYPDISDTNEDDIIISNAMFHISNDQGGSSVMKFENGQGKVTKSASDDHLSQVAKSSAQSDGRDSFRAKAPRNL